MTKVLIIGMLDSVHLGRWLGQFRDQKLEFTLFPSSPHRKIHGLIEDLLIQPSIAKYSLVPGARWLGLPLWLADRFLDNRIRGSLVRKHIGLFGPEIVHALELQNAGYVLLRALEREIRPKPKIILTNYGSDIFWFRQFPTHKSKLVRLLSLADAYGCECFRDARLARELGFEGEIHPPRPNAGGFSDEVMRIGGYSQEARSVIAIKGYHGWAGRAHNAIRALELVEAQARQFDVVVYSCNLSTRFLAALVAIRTGLKIKTYGKRRLPHSEVLGLFAKSVIYVGVSESDGISTSMLEAMTMGAIPVQTSTACCDEWFDKTGVKIRDTSVEAVANAIIKGLELAKDPSNRITNRETIYSKASEEYVREAALAFYR